MNRPTKDAVRRYRRDSQNPYACIDYLEEEEAKSESVEASASAIKASRESLENPYAHLDSEGGFSSIERSVLEDRLAFMKTPTKAGKDKRYTDDEIEAIVVDLQRQLWRDRYQLWNANPPTNPVDVLDIEKALGLVGFRFELSDTLGRFTQDGKQIEVAGLFDPESKIVYGSQQFDLGPSMNFTLAHELAHAVLHQDLGTLHRDRLKDGTYRSHEPYELEADKFAAFYLMPRKLVLKQFRETFGCRHFELNEDTIKGLKGATWTLEKFAKGKRGAVLRRHLTRELVDAERYNGRHFKSLRAQFNVSVETMAIRLEELSLV